MTARTAMALAWVCLLAAFGCAIAVGLFLAERVSAVGWPLVVVFVGLIVLVIVLDRLSRKKYNEEWRNLR